MAVWLSHRVAPPSTCPGCNSAFYPPRQERDRLSTTLSAGKVLTEKGCMGQKKGIIVLPVLKIIIVCFFVLFFFYF